MYVCKMQYVCVKSTTVIPMISHKSHWFPLVCQQIQEFACGPTSVASVAMDLVRRDGWACPGLPRPDSWTYFTYDGSCKETSICIHIYIIYIIYIYYRYVYYVYVIYCSNECVSLYTCINVLYTFVYTYKQEYLQYSRRALKPSS